MEKHRNSFFSSITFRLTLLVAVIGFSFGSIGVTIAVFSAKKKLTNVIQKQQLAFAEYIANDIDTEISKNLSFFTNLAKEFSKKPFEELDFEEGTHIPPVFKYGIVLITPDGKGLIAQYPVVHKRKELLFNQSEWFHRARVAETVIFSKPFKNQITLEPSIVFAVPVKNERNELIAVAAGIVELKQPELFKHIYTSRIGASGGVLVVSPKDKLFIASNIPEMVLTPTPKPGKNHLHDKAMAGYRGVGVTVNAFGAEELSAIADVKSTGWFVVVRIPVSEAYLPVKQLSKSLILYTTLLVSVMVLIIIAALVIMLSPLKNAARSVKQMASEKQLLGKLPVVYNDEVGDLAEGFNNLVDMIYERAVYLESAKRELENVNNELERIANIDALTELANRRYFDDFFDIEWKRAKREKNPVAIILCDIDFFKKYNDTYGHQAGDSCLKQVAQAIGAGVKRPTDLPARYGGEEFIVVLSNTDLEGAMKVAEDIYDNVKKLTINHSASDVSEHVSLSIGVSVTLPSDLRGKEDLIKDADQALYEAKRKGRNMVLASDKTMEFI